MAINKMRAEDSEYGRMLEVAARNGQPMLFGVERKIVAEMAQKGGKFKPLTLEDLTNQLNALRGDKKVNFETVARLIMFCLPEYRYIGYPSDSLVISLVCMLREGRRIDDAIRAALKPSPSMATREMVSSLLGRENIYGAAADVEIDHNAMKREAAFKHEKAGVETDAETAETEK